jgi:hypothetical protein
MRQGKRKRGRERDRERGMKEMRNVRKRRK